MPAAGSTWRLRIACALLLGAVAPANLPAQCAMCATAAESGSVSRGLTISILFLLGALITVVAGIVGLILRAQRRAARVGPQVGPVIPRG